MNGVMTKESPYELYLYRSSDCVIYNVEQSSCWEKIEINKEEIVVWGGGDKVIGRIMFQDQQVVNQETL